MLQKVSMKYLKYLDDIHYNIANENYVDAAFMLGRLYTLLEYQIEDQNDEYDEEDE